MTDDFASYMPVVARALLGKPNPRHSKEGEWRYGTNGSLSIDLDKGTFYDHETGQCVNPDPYPQIGTNRFVRSPDSCGWVHEGDLPTAKARAMYDRIEREHEWHEWSASLTERNA